jgi:hypothetical protein
MVKNKILTVVCFIPPRQNLPFLSLSAKLPPSLNPLNPSPLLKGKEKEKWKMGG